jgi:hypothetical protein
MARWEDDEFWTDSDEHHERFRFQDSDPGDDEPESLLEEPTTEALEGTVYMVPDPCWGFHIPHREDHPGACVCCDLGSRLTFLNKGTDPKAARGDRYLILVIEPTPENGLSKPTAFALDPRPIRLHRLLTLHHSPRRLGRLETHQFLTMRHHFDALRRLGGGDGP